MVPATTEPFEPDTLLRLARLTAQGHRVLSIYLDLDPTHFPTPRSLDAQLGSLLAEARKEGFECDAGRIKAWLGSHPSAMRGGRGLAVFSAADADVFEAVRLPTPVEPFVVVDVVPWLEPMAAILAPGERGVAVVSRRYATLFRGGPDGLSQFATIDDEVHGRHAQGGWSQARYQRGIEKQVAFRVRGVTDRLLRAHLRRPFEHLVVICSDELHPVLTCHLNGSLNEVLAEIIHADLEHASVEEIVRAIAPVVQRTAGEHERELLTAVERALATGGPAAAGLDEVSEMLKQAVDRAAADRRRSWSSGTTPSGSRSTTMSRACCAGRRRPPRTRSSSPLKRAPLQPLAPRPSTDPERRP